KKALSIVRISGKDIDGSYKIERALMEIRGIGMSYAHALSFAINQKAGIDPNLTIGSLTEQQLDQIESILKEPEKNGIPDYMLNRRKDMESGKDIHIIGNELIFSVRQSINRDVGLRTWRGYRHQNHLRVRGQHERSTGRTGSTVGVVKKKVLVKPESGKPAGPQPASAPSAPQAK
ncbi:Ribosomal protein S13, partial [mine drainage metagenome]